MTKIRTVDELEDLRVSLSMQLESAKKTVKSQDDLLHVKQLRIALTDVIDELLAAKNIAADAEKERMLQDIRNHEHDNQTHYEEYYKLLQDVVPALQVVVDNLDRANQLSSWMRSDVTTIEQLKGHYNREYQESIEAVGHGARGVPDHEQVNRTLEWLQSDYDSYKARFKEMVEPSKVKVAVDKADFGLAPSKLSGGSRVMKSVIKKGAIIKAKPGVVVAGDEVETAQNVTKI